MVKNSPAMQGTWVQSLGWEDPLEQSMATHSNSLALRIPMDRGAWQILLSDQAQHIYVFKETLQYAFLFPELPIFF